MLLIIFAFYFKHSRQKKGLRVTPCLDTVESVSRHNQRH